jgi:hypothetical protein
VYERLASARGVQAYVLLHGLVIAERGALGGLAGGLPRGPHGYLAVQKLVARLSRGRLTSAHEDLLYVIRKPEDRFARYPEPGHGSAGRLKTGLSLPEYPRACLAVAGPG